VPANEFMNLEGRKLSKSRGWVIEPHEILERYDPDIIRYTIACNLPESKDSDFAWKDLQAHTNNELADILGNYANRTLTFVKNNFDGKIPEAICDEQYLNAIGLAAKEIGELYEKCRLREATSATFDIVRSANKYFNDNEPWKLIKSDKARAAQVLRTCLEVLRSVSIYIAPILPGTSQKINEMLNIDTTSVGWDTAHDPALRSDSRLGEIKVLFPKLENEQIEAEVKRMQDMASKAEQNAAPIASPQKITVDDFKKIKLKTAKVLEAERVPKSKKLLKLQITIGEERRQIVAGIAEKYTPEEIVGKTIVVVANLEPAKLMGIESQGMLLAVNDDKGVVSLITAERESLDGLEVR
jgi:methionyl-tRNA synthetase